SEDSWRRQRGQLSAAVLITRQLGRGSPHWRHRGGVSVTIASQQRRHTGPRLGCSSETPHAAQAGAISTAIRLSATRRTIERGSGGLAVDRRLVADLDPLGVAPEPLEAVELPGVG